ncbi:MAG: acyl-CoA carboxylase subunit beta [Caulobacterales bacterium]|nr:acyl-CoA carboxylase subunit beta [Caulobacterales bacterium]
MPVFKSRISTRSEAYQKNRADMLALVDQLRALEARAVAASSKRNATFAKRGQIPPHERIARLLDPGMPFLRLHTLANYLLDDDDPETSVPGASMICGIGFVRGARCMIWADDSGIRAGAMTSASLPTALSIQDMAKRQKLPLIHLVESAGANLMGYFVEGWAKGGALFRNLAQMSAAGLPTMAVLHGPSTAGGAYMPGLSDYVIGVKKNGLAALAGAALVKAATGEEADERELGGAEMHASVSGLVEYLAEDDAHGLAIARDVIGRLNWNARGAAPPRRPYEPPLYDIDDIAGVAPTDHRISYDVREVLARVVDGSDFDEFKPRYGVSTVCVQASIMGHGCALIGNNGPIDPQGATKAAHFLQLCDQSELPIIFLNNTTGYMVGTEYEKAGMIKHGAKMIQAVANVRTPRITLYIGASYGAGNYGMSGYAYEPDFLFSWPNASTGVMGGEQAAKTMTQVAEVAAARSGRKPDPDALKAQEEAINAHFSRQESAFYTSGRTLDHGVIDPRDTRRVLGFALETCLEARLRRLHPNSFGAARM